MQALTIMKRFRQNMFTEQLTKRQQKSHFNIKLPVIKFRHHNFARNSFRFFGTRSNCIFISCQEQEETRTIGWEEKRKKEKKEKETTASHAFFENCIIIIDLQWCIIGCKTYYVSPHCIVCVLFFSFFPTRVQCVCVRKVVESLDHVLTIKPYHFQMSMALFPLFSPFLSHMLMQSRSSFMHLKKYSFLIWIHWAKGERHTQHTATTSVSFHTKNYLDILLLLLLLADSTFKNHFTEQNLAECDNCATKGQQFSKREKWKTCSQNVDQ